jgi:hypothetical protein
MLAGPPEGFEAVDRVNTLKTNRFFRDPAETDSAVIEQIARHEISFGKLAKRTGSPPRTRPVAD